jgi:hypothetical protein
VADNTFRRFDSLVSAAYQPNLLSASEYPALGVSCTSQASFVSPAIAGLQSASSLGKVLNIKTSQGSRANLAALRPPRSIPTKSCSG